jgi:uncharacterized Zn finger protein
MRSQNIVQACPACGKETTLAVTKPHPTHPEIELRTYRCVDCGLVKTTSALRLETSRLPHAA